MSLANFFTASRIVAAPLFVLLFFLPQYTAVTEQTVVIILIPLFIYLEFTDFLDGYFARKYKQVSDFGKIFDPFADVVANITILLLFMLAGYLPLAFFIIILYREMGILFLRMVARGEGITIAAKKGGKLKTVVYIIAEGFSLALYMLHVSFDADAALLAQLAFVNKVVYGIAVILSVVSFFDYLNSYLKTRKKSA